jgi:hypothetical protein
MPGLLFQKKFLGKSVLNYNSKIPLRIFLNNLQEWGEHKPDKPD